MASNKTVPTNLSVTDFLNGLEPDRRKDCKALAKMMRSASGKRAKMWGTSIVGFGKYHYKYASGREGEFFLTGFAPRKNNLTVYLMDGFESRTKELQQLGPHKTGKSCLYLKRLSDVDEDVLQSLIDASVEETRKRFPG